MSLSKKERIWKKKLFRHLEIKGKTKQKEVNKKVIASMYYKIGGYGLYLYYSKKATIIMHNVLANVPKLVRDITKGYIRFSNATKVATSSLTNLGQTLKGCGVSSIINDEL